MLGLRKNDRSLIKIYKDLMVTKRDLIDLRESISNTIASIQNSDRVHQEMASHLRKGLFCDKCGQRNNPAAPHQCSIAHATPNQKCCHCPYSFRSKEDLLAHQKDKHKICCQCKILFSESIEEHEQFYCGEKKLNCEGCMKMISKKNLDSHVKICCFRECYKCRKEIFIKAFTFHLQECKRNGKKILINQHKSLPKQQMLRPIVLPCCLVLEEMSFNN